MWSIPLLHGYVLTHLFRCHALYVICPPTLGLQCLYVCFECVFRYLVYFLYHEPLPSPHVISYQPVLSLALLLYSVPACGFLRFQLRLFIDPSTPFRPIYPVFSRQFLSLRYQLRLFIGPSTPFRPFLPHVSQYNFSALC